MWSSTRPLSLLRRTAGRSTGRSTTGRRLAAAAALTALAAGVGLAPASAASAPSSSSGSTAAASGNGSQAMAATPYMGWSSWSMQSSNYPGLNPKGMGSYLSEAHVLQQADALASKLKKYGYDYVNIDAGWWMNWAWQSEYDKYGRQTPDPERFPHGMKYVADHIHAKGLKAGIYLPVGLEKGAYGDGTVPIADAPGCTTGDIVYPDLRTTNGWDSAYKIDFSEPCAQKYIDSQARMLAGWGYDFLKIDGVGPGSFKSGDNYDNIPDITAWKKAIAATGRPIHLELSWALDVNHVADWQRLSNGWRIETDVECYCDTLVTWENSINNRWDDAPAWTPYAKPGGWNDLDSLDVGNGQMDGITQDERQSYMTLWAIESSPLYTGDDLTKLDDYGLSLLTNREVIAVDQQGIPARPVTPTGDHQVWGMRNKDGSYTVALFNLGTSPADVTAHWTSFGFTGGASVRDLWSHRELGTHTDGITETLPAHGSRLFRVVPRHKADLTGYEAESGANTLIGSASVSGCDACSGGQKVGNLYLGGALRFNNVTVPADGTYEVNIRYASADPRSAQLSTNGGPATTVDFPSSGGWSIPATTTVALSLKAGRNTITFDSGTWYSPDLDRIDVPAKPAG
jgi:Alpha galactosidase A/Alpha galactosidase C-terminal beta sandwich domain/Carbohydrate binding module (family 35)